MRFAIRRLVGLSLLLWLATSLSSCVGGADQPAVTPSAAVAHPVVTPSAEITGSILRKTKTRPPVTPAWEPPPGAYRWRNTVIREWRSYFGLEADISNPFAQIMQESEYREDAVSRVGAEGLGQFMPATARGYQKNLSRLQELCAEPAGCPREGAWAIRALSAYDSDEYRARPWARDEEQRLKLMWAAYNGGGGWITRERARARLDGLPDDIWDGGIALVCLRSDAACRENRAYPIAIVRWREGFRAWLAR